MAKTRTFREPVPGSPSRRPLYTRPIRYIRALRSEQWKSLKERVIRERGERCEQCGVSAVPDKSLAKLLDMPCYLHLHHCRYDRVGHELSTDVILLCPQCHSKEHAARRRISQEG